MALMNAKWMSATLGLGCLLAGGSGVAHAGVISWFGLLKGRDYEQVAPPPAVPELSNYSALAFAVASEPDNVIFGTVQTSGDIPIFLAPKSEDPTELEGEQTFDSAAELNAAFPPGPYPFTFFQLNGGMPTGTLSLGATAFLPPPVLKNFAAAQDINPAQPFTLEWDPIPGMTASDFVIVGIDGDDGFVVESPFPWRPGALPGNTTSFTIPAGSFPEGGQYWANITLVKVDQINLTAIPEATGVTGTYVGTEIGLKVRGSGGSDTTPPVLVLTSPANGATGVATDRIVTFTFTEAMRPQQAIQWTGVANPASFVYSWTQGGTQLNCILPGGFQPGLVTWQLNPASFQDLAGNSLFPFQLNGQFTVGGAGCSNDIEDQADMFLVARFADFIQTSDAPPVLASGGEDPAAGFFSSLRPVTFIATAASFTAPGRNPTPLTPLFGTYLFQEPFANEAATTAAYPDGSYTVSVTHAGGTAVQSVTLGGAPTLPRCANWTAAQSIDPTQDFILRWDAFAGATANDLISLELWDGDTQILELPDECSNPPRLLAATATSTTFPANLLAPDRTYSVSLSFIRASDRKENTNPAFTVLAGYARTTEFTIRTVGSSPNIVPVVTGYRVANDGRFEVDVTASPGRTLTLQATADFIQGPWTDVGTALVPAGGTVTVRDSRSATQTFQGFRVRAQ